MTNPRHAPPFRIDAAAILRRAGPRGLAIIAPHPDDETLGCGALIARAARAGSRIIVISLTDGDASHPGSCRWPPKALAALRASEQRRALARLGAGRAQVRRLGASDGDVDELAALRRLRACLAAIRPGILLVTSAADHHPDHRAAARLACRAAKPLRIPIIAYEVWARVEALRRRTDRYQPAKRWAIAAHRSQLGAYISDAPGGFRLSPLVLGSLIGGSECFTAM